MAISDFEAVLHGARAGDERAFADLWRRFHPRLRRYLRVVDPSSDAEDLASITWLDVVRGLHRFEGGEEQFLAWLFTIARHRVYDQRRNAARRVRTVAAETLEEPLDLRSDPQELTEAAAATEAALAMLATLPDDQAEVVALRVIAGFDVNTVAELTGRKAGTVRVITHRAMRKLAEKVAADEGSPVPRNDWGADGA